ncbi:MAG: hypothetical protein R8G66_02085 [Cytophagales bacterium]|nr:hypothetical protein [Cytophagales bacterium]
MSTTHTNPSASQEVTFHDEHRPFLDEGTYQVTFNQNIIGKQVISEKINDKDKTVPDEEKGFKLDLKPQEIDFNVAGPRFQMPPSIVHAVHPPSGGQGNYLSHLPKLTFKRSTLPWERSPQASGHPATNSASWLFLLLVDETEKDKVEELNGVKLAGSGVEATLKMADNSVVGTIADLKGDIDLHPDPFNALAVDQTWAKQLIPVTLEELQYLSYASTKQGEHEHGVILGNRLPIPGNNSTVYLISLENNFESDSFQGKVLNGKYFFPYFYKWSFHTNVDYLVTEAISTDLARQFPQEESLTPIIDQLFTSWEAFDKNPLAGNLSKDATAWVKQKAKLPGVTFHGLLHNLTAGFKAFNLVTEGSGLTSIGTIQMPFESLDKDPSEKAYYHGPLVAAKVNLPTQLGLPMKDAGDWNMQLKATKLYLTNSTTQQMDVSYGAAMELGRLTALNNVAFAEAFISWKKQAAVAVYQGSPAESHLSFYPNAQYSADIPDHIRQQFEDWKHLKSIPYQYLIPDPDLLPLESLRYFYLDTNWINAFLYGAFSIGHTIRPNSLKPLLNELMMENSTKYQGFLLNSFAVNGWPDFEVNASQNSAPVRGLYIPRKNLAKNMVLQVYDQNFDQLEFQLHHSKNHSGFLSDEVQVQGKMSYQFLKTIEVETTTKDSKGQSPKKMVQQHKVANINHQNRIESLQGLAGQINASNVSEFAKQMLEGTPKVLFSIK